MKKMFAAVAVAAMALTGCGSTCDHLSDAYADAQEKAKPCASEGSEFQAFNVNQCENNLDKCTDSEKEALEDFADCIQDLPECTPSNPDSFGNAFLACALVADGKVGANCASTVGGN